MLSLALLLSVVSTLASAQSSSCSREVIGTCPRFYVTAYVCVATDFNDQVIQEIIVYAAHSINRFQDAETLVSRGGDVYEAAHNGITVSITDGDWGRKQVVHNGSVCPVILN